MKQCIKKISFLMAFIMLISLMSVTFTGCFINKLINKNGENTSESVVDGNDSTDGNEDVFVETDVNYKEYLPQTTYDGADVNLYVVGTDTEEFFVAEGKESLTNFDTAIYNRNAYIEKTYDVVLNYDYEKTHDIEKYTLVCVQSGAYEYDIVAPHYWWGLESQGAFVNLLDYSVLQLDNPYWLGSWNEKATVNGKIFSVAGYLSMHSVAESQALFYNKTLLETTDHGSDSLDELVYSGNWTLEEMRLLMAQNTFEVDGDGIFTFEDSYGLGYNLWGGRAFLWGAGLTLAEYDVERDKVTFRFRDAKNSAVFDAVYALLNDNDYSYYKDNENLDYEVASDTDRNLFMQGRSLFFVRNLSDSIKFADSAILSDFGVAPMPKFDKDQNDYITPLLGNTVFAIFKTSADPERAATILEAMCILSYEDVLPLYYETNLKLRYQTDPNAAEMLDFVRSKTSVDFMFINEAHFDHMSNDAFDLIVAEDSNYEAKMQTRLQQMPGYLEKFMEFYAD